MSDWNRCNVCGKFIPYEHFAENKARHALVAPQSDLSEEEYETLCMEHMDERLAV